MERTAPDAISVLQGMEIACNEFTEKAARRPIETVEQVHFKGKDTSFYFLSGFNRTAVAY
jgi:hypothetical protein